MFLRHGLSFVRLPASPRGLSGVFCVLIGRCKTRHHCTDGGEEKKTTERHGAKDCDPQLLIDNTFGIAFFRRRPRPLSVATHFDPVMLSATRSALFRQAARRAPAASAKGAIRCLNVHEYISMEIMQQHGISTPKCFVASTPQEAEDLYLKKMNTGEYKCCGKCVAITKCCSKRVEKTTPTTRIPLPCRRRACRRLSSNFLVLCCRNLCHSPRLCRSKSNPTVYLRA